MQLWPLMEEKLIKGSRPFISLTGGGGKTTFLILFAKYLKRRGKSVLLTTTTKLASPGKVDYGFDHFFSSFDEIIKAEVKKGEVTLFALVDGETGKLYNPGEDKISEVALKYDVVLSEADGSRGMPLKIHTSRDPAIMRETSAVVSIVGGWGIGEKTFDVAFGEKRCKLVDKSYLEEYLFSPEGPCKGMREDTENIILFNGGDILSEGQMEVIKSLSLPSGVSIYIVSEKEGIVYHALQYSR